MKYTTKSADETSFFGHAFQASVQDLRSILGEPKFECNDGSDKTNFEWVMETESGEVFTVYDWKEYKKLKETEIIEWHVGGHWESVTGQAVNEIADALNQLG